jgi:hypothetical protein
MVPVGLERLGEDRWSYEHRGGVMVGQLERSAGFGETPRGTACLFGWDEGRGTVLQVLPASVQSMIDNDVIHVGQRVVWCRRCQVGPFFSVAERTDPGLCLDCAPVAAGWISASGGKWHRATVSEPTWSTEQTAACGMTFRPRNVTWHGEKPPTVDLWKCKRPGCTSIVDAHDTNGADF